MVRLGGPSGRPSCGAAGQRVDGSGGLGGMTPSCITQRRRRGSGKEDGQGSGLLLRVGPKSTRRRQRGNQHKHAERQAGPAEPHGRTDGPWTAHGRPAAEQHGLPSRGPALPLPLVPPLGRGALARFGRRRSSHRPFGPHWKVPPFSNYYKRGLLRAASFEDRLFFVVRDSAKTWRTLSYFVLRHHHGSSVLFCFVFCPFGRVLCCPPGWSLTTLLFRKHSHFLP